MKKFMSAAFAAFVLVLMSGLTMSAWAETLYQSSNPALAQWATKGTVKSVSEANSSGALIEALGCVPGPCTWFDYEFLGVPTSAENPNPFITISQPYYPNTFSDTASAMKRDFYVSSPTYLNFDYKTLTNEYAGIPDYTFFVLDSKVYALGLVANFPTFIGEGANGYVRSNGWAHYTLALEAGLHTLVFGAAQGHDTINSTALLVDNVTVPEPSSVALMGLAMAGLVFARRRKS